MSLSHFFMQNMVKHSAFSAPKSTLQAKKRISDIPATGTRRKGSKSKAKGIQGAMQGNNELCSNQWHFAECFFMPLWETRWERGWVVSVYVMYVKCPPAGPRLSRAPVSLSSGCVIMCGLQHQPFLTPLIPFGILLELAGTLSNFFFLKGCRQELVFQKS